MVEGEERCLQVNRDGWKEREMVEGEVRWLKVKRDGKR
jgi:hypothetical protein